MDVSVIETSGLGDRSYVVIDGGRAVIIDPQRDIDRVLDAAGDARITHVLETHIHNDYVTGGSPMRFRPTRRCTRLTGSAASARPRPSTRTRPPSAGNGRPTRR